MLLPLLQNVRKKLGLIPGRNPGSFGSPPNGPAGDGLSGLDDVRRARWYNWAASKFNSMKGVTTGSEFDNLGMGFLDGAAGTAPPPPREDAKFKPPMRQELNRPGRNPPIADNLHPDGLPLIEMMQKKGDARKATTSTDQARVTRFWRVLVDDLQKLFTGSDCIDSTTLGHPLDGGILGQAEEHRDIRRATEIMEGIDQDCMTPPCYELESIDDSSITCVTTNAIAVAGGCVEIGGVCYKVRKSIDATDIECKLCNDTTTVTLGDEYPEDDAACSACLVDYPPCLNISASACGFCTTATTVVVVVISGHVLCTNCFTTGGVDHDMAGSSADGTYELGVTTAPHAADPCIWAVSSAAIVTDQTRVTGDGSCGAAAGAPSTVAYNFSLTKTDAVTYQLDITIPDSFNWLGVTTRMAFTGTATVASDFCLTDGQSIVITNAQSVCSTSSADDPVVAGIGGSNCTATITCKT